jgi:hypothetical protein
LIEVAKSARQVAWRKVALDGEPNVRQPMLLVALPVAIATRFSYEGFDWNEATPWFSVVAPLAIATAPRNEGAEPL